MKHSKKRDGNSGFADTLASFDLINTNPAFRDWHSIRQEEPSLFNGDQICQPAGLIGSLALLHSLAPLTMPASTCRADICGQTVHGISDSCSSWLPGIARAVVVVIYTADVVGPLGHASSLTYSLGLIEVEALPYAEFCCLVDHRYYDLLRLLRPLPPRFRLSPYTSGHHVVFHRCPEVSLVPPSAFAAFRSPYAGEFFEVAFQTLHLFHGLRAS